MPLRGRRLRRRVDRLLEAVELQDAGRRRADRFSGGMIRRLGLAQAVLHSPRFLVVDEPTAGLDPEERIRFRNLITDLADEIPVLLSTHIVEDIEATCPRLVIIAAGRRLFDGPPGELMRRGGGYDTLEEACSAILFGEADPGGSGSEGDGSEGDGSEAAACENDERQEGDRD